MTPELQRLLDPRSVFFMFVVFMLGMATQNYIFILTLLGYTGLVLVNRFPPYKTGGVLFWLMLIGLGAKGLLL
jgi:apolipoprotein N-acyltransferase